MHTPTHFLSVAHTHTLPLKVQAVVTARNMALPYVFWVAEWLEKFHPRTALKIKLVRLFLLYLSSLYVLIISLFTLSSQCVSLATLTVLHCGGCVCVCVCVLCREKQVVAVAGRTL